MLMAGWSRTESVGDRIHLKNMRYVPGVDVRLDGFGYSKGGSFSQFGVMISRKTRVLDSCLSCAQ